MQLIVNTPYSVVALDQGDDPAYIDILRKSLTAKMTSFNSYGPPQIIYLPLLETVDGTQYKFRTGLLERVKTLAITSGLSVSEVDLRYSPDNKLEFPKYNGKLRDYQEEAVLKAVNRDGGVISAATGAGKTYMAAAIIARRQLSTLFLVHTKELLWQTKAQFEKILGVPIGVIGDGELKVEPITVSTVQTMFNVIKEGKLSISFDMMIIDECHHVPCQTFYQVTGAFRCRYVYGLSATPYRKDKADLMIEAGAGPVIHKITPDDLIAKGYLSKPLIKFIPITGIETSTSMAPRHAIYNKHIVKCEPRNNAIKDQAVLYSGQGKSVLIAVNWTTHADILKEKMPYAVLLTGKTPAPDRHQILADLKEKKIKVLISTLMKEGVDIPSLDVVINAAGGTDPIQLIGRVLRIVEGSKDSAVVIDMIDNQHKALLANSMARLKRCQKVKNFVVTMGGT